MFRESPPRSSTAAFMSEDEGDDIRDSSFNVLISLSPFYLLEFAGQKKTARKYPTPVFLWRSVYRLGLSSYSRPGFS